MNIDIQIRKKFRNAPHRCGRMECGDSECHASQHEDADQSVQLILGSLHPDGMASLHRYMYIGGQVN